MALRFLAAGLVAITLGAAPLAAQQVNVALGRTVNAEGVFGNSRPGSPWAPQPAPAAFSTLTDGVFLTAGTQWDNGTIWWDRGFTPSPTEPYNQTYGNFLWIDLGAVYNITGVKIQGDNNDEYNLWWKVDAADAWQEDWTYAPVSGGAGMRTRGLDLLPSVFHKEARYVGISGLRGDGFYSLSELALFATVPEPSSLGLLAVGLSALALTARRRRA